MFAERNVIYMYDGSLDGFYCCVFESFSRRETPCGISVFGAPQYTLMPTRTVETDPQKAARVSASIPKKISREAADLIKSIYLSCLADKELLSLKFLQLGFKLGRRVTQHLTNDIVVSAQKAARRVNGEAGAYNQFIRFSDTNGMLTAVIEPQNTVLPLIAGHFIARYPNERLFIYDSTHGMALMYAYGKAAIIPVDNFEQAPPDMQEEKYRSLWCTYYDSVAIESRYNPRCRMSHMPKRYWTQMTEFVHPRPTRADRAKLLKEEDKLPAVL